MSKHHRWWRTLAATACTTVAIASTQAVLATPAHAGQVGATLTLSGQGRVLVVEGRSGSDPSGCSAPEGVTLNDQVTDCGRWRTEAAFEAWVWFRALPGLGGETQWTFDNWEGCDKTRYKDGYRECGVGSGAFSSDEKNVRARFVDRFAPEAPSVTVTTKPGVERTIGYSATTATRSDRFQCSIDDAAWEACAATGTRQLAEGEHVLAVRAYDVNGNIGPSKRQYFFVVDTAVVSGPPVLTRSSTAEFAVSSEVGRAFYCAVDDQERTQPCATGSGTQTFRLDALADGPHLVRVVAERDGWRDAVAASYRWTIDTVAPTTTVVSDGGRGNTAFAVVVSASESSTSECRTTREGATPGAWVACAQSINTVSDLAPGAYLFEARSTDEAGNLGPVTTYRHVASATGPAVTITPTITGRSASFTITAPEAQTLQCLETHPGTPAGVFRTCSSPVRMTDLVDGDHALQVRAWDRYGNFTTPMPIYRWTVGGTTPTPTPTPTPVDTTAPDTTLVGGPVEGSVVPATTASLRATATETASFACSLDGATVSCPGGQVTLGGLTAGRHVLSVAAVDAAGNRDASPAARSWIVPVSSRALVAGRKQAKGFKQVTTTGAFGGSEAVAKRKGATLTTTVTAARTIALVAAPGRGQGKVTVSLGGRTIATLNLATGTSSTAVLTLPALAAPYTGPVVITSKSAKKVRIQGVGAG